MKTSEVNPRYVICIRNEAYSAALEVRKVYRVVRDN
jgi:hypothetical protein